MVKKGSIKLCFVVTALLLLVGSVEGQTFNSNAGVNKETSYDRVENVSVVLTSWTDGNPFLLYTTTRAVPKICYNNIQIQIWAPNGTPYKIRRDMNLGGGSVNLSIFEDLVSLRIGVVGPDGWSKEVVMMADQVINQFEVVVGNYTFKYPYLTVYSSYVPGLEPDGIEGGWIPAEVLGQARNETFFWAIIGVFLGIYIAYRLAKYEEETRVVVR